MKYTELQLDVIKEFANVGGGNAASSISELISKPVNMTVPRIELLNYDEVYEEIMTEDKNVNAVITGMTGDAEGIFLFIIDDETFDGLVKMMLPSGMDINEELSESAIKELGNILVNSYLNAIVRMVEVQLASTVPLLVKDMFGAILSSVYMESGQYDDEIMLIRNEFLYEGDRMEGELYFVPEPGVLKGLFKILGVGEDQ